MRRSLLVFLLVLGSSLVKADIAETQEFQRRKDKLEEVNELLLHNRTIEQLTPAELKQYHSNVDNIIALDKAIIASQEETIKRVASYAGVEHNGKSRIVGYAFLLTLITLMSLYFLYLMNRKMNIEGSMRVGYFSRLKEFMTGTLMIVNPPKSVARSAAVTNLLIMFALGFMFLSFIAYLMKIV